MYYVIGSVIGLGVGLGFLWIIEYLSAYKLWSARGKEDAREALKWWPSKNNFWPFAVIYRRARRREEKRLVKLWQSSDSVESFLREVES